MANALAIIFTMSMIGIVFGMINPGLVIRWGDRKTRKQVLKIYGLISLALFIGIVIVAPPKNPDVVTNKSEETLEVSQAPSKEEKTVTDNNIPGSSSPTRTKPEKSYEVLELQSWSWSTQHGYAIAEGTVKNISDNNLRNVEVVVNFSDKNGRFITSADALIEYNPILPGQTSPFKAMATANPAMEKASIDFKTLMGGTIQWKTATK